MIVVAIAFLPVLRNGFIAMDDPQYVTKNLHVQGGLTPEALGWAFTTTDADNWHPMTWISHTIDWSLFGSDPWGHHLTSLLLHAANSALLFLALRRMTGAGVESAIVALLFGLHPLRVESVAWVAERKDVLSSLFGFLTLLVYARHAVRPTRASRVLLPALFGLALLAKPMWVTLPVLLLLLDVWPLRRRAEGTVRLVVEKLPLVALSMASVAVTFWAQSSGGAVASFERVPVAARCANALVSTVKYLGDTFWPAGLALYYPHPGVSLPAWQPVGASLLVLTVSVAVFAARRRAPYLLVGWLWYLVALIPVIGIVQVGWQARADRYTYLPQIGVLMAIVWGLRDLAPGVFRGAIRRGHVLPMLALPVLALATWHQLGYWRDSRILAQHALAVTGDNATVLWMLGNVAAGESKTDEAVVHFREALRIQPRFPEVHLALATLLAERGDFDDALVHAEAVLRMWPDDTTARVMRGRVLARAGRQTEALAHFRAWAYHQPNSAEAYAELGAELGRAGRPAEAVAALTYAVGLRPELSEAHSNLAAALLETGRIAEAREHLRLAREAGFNSSPALVRRLEPLE
jgi:Flp pilus assembly protein TadD